MSNTINHIIDVDIVSGFLGAGKTTLIRQFMKDRVYEDKLIVLENEFGEVNVDGELLQNAGVEVESIVSSCICCSGADTLIIKLNEIAIKHAPYHLIIEPTGVASLSDLRRVFQYPVIRDMYHLNRIITVVDALNYPIWLKVSKAYFNNQIKFSDIIYISKTDQCDSQQLNKLLKMVKTENPHALVFVDINQLSSSWNCVCKKDKPHFVYVMQRNDNDKFETFSVTGSLDINVDSLKALFQKINDGLFGSVYRIKGSLRVESGRYLTVNLIANSYTLSIAEKSDFENTNITIIGRDLKCNCLQQEFEQIKINQ